MSLRSLLYHTFWKKTYDKYEFKQLIQKGRIVDGRNGGLILGSSHEQGGIFLYQFNEDHFIMDAEIEGNEYYVNRYAFDEQESRVRQINEYYPTALPKPQQISSQTEPMNINADGFRKAIFVSAGMVVNARATQKYIAELDTMNRKYQKRWLTVDELFNPLRHL